MMFYCVRFVAECFSLNDIRVHFVMSAHFCWVHFGVGICIRVCAMHLYSELRHNEGKTVHDMLDTCGNGDKLRAL